MSSFPVMRLRRFRRTSGLRGLVRETRLSLDDFVMPLFIGPEAFANDELPGAERVGMTAVQLRPPGEELTESGKAWTGASVEHLREVVELA